MRGWVLGAAVAAVLPCAPAVAENTSTLQTAKLDTDFTLCTDAAGSCSAESWHIAINAKGWTARGATQFEGNTDNWSEACADGRYTSDAGGFDWTGTCRIQGDPDALCFEVAMESKTANASTTSEQCFQLLAPHICTMRFGSETGGFGAPASSPDRVKTTLGTVNSCVVSEAR